MLMFQIRSLDMEAKQQQQHLMILKIISILLISNNIIANNHSPCTKHFFPQYCFKKFIS